MKKNDSCHFYPLYLLAVAVRLTITANLLVSLYLFNQSINQSDVLADNSTGDMKSTRLAWLHAVKKLLHANTSNPTCRKSGWDPLYPAHQKGRSALSQHQGNTSQGIELWVTSSCARLGHIIVPPPCTMGSSAVVALGHSTYKTRTREVRAVTHQIW